MKSTAISTAHAPGAVGPYSQAIRQGDTLYVSGQIPLDPATGALAGTDIARQTHQVMHNLGAILEAAGLAWSDVVKTTCFLTDLADFAEFNAIYATYLTGKPARSCVAVSALPKGAKLEVDLIAVSHD